MSGKRAFIIGFIATTLTVAISGSASAQSGAEQRCSELGSNCVCSEPLESGGQNFSTGYDFPDSPDSKECWGNRSGASSFQVGNDNNKSMVDISSDPGWGNASSAVNHRGSYIWMNPPKVDSGALKIDSSVRTYCMRYYIEVDDTYSPAGSSHDSANGRCETVHRCNRNGDYYNCRNKTFQANFGGYLVQGEERSSGDCPGAGAHNPLDFYVSGAALDKRYTPSPAVNLNHCDGAPCRLEMCIDGNISTGKNLQVRVRYTSLEPGGPEGYAVSDVFSAASGPTISDFWGGDFFHSGPDGGSRISHFMVGSWTSDTNQWIGPAAEIEGSTSSSSTPPSSSRPASPVFLE